MTASEIIDVIIKTGAKLQVVDGNLSISAPAGKMTTEMLNDLRLNKSDVMAAIQGLTAVETPMGKNQIRPSCWACSHYDGSGASWPGLCRYFETIGQEAKEIDFNKVDPVTGCNCFTPMPAERRAENLEALNLPELPSGDDPDWITPAMYLKPTTRGKGIRRKPSPVALEWLQENRTALKEAGWTMRELYRRNKVEGICWSGVWGKPFFKAYLHDDGVIEFEFVDGGRDVIQTARPLSSGPKI